MFDNLVCPISHRRIDRNVVRVNGLVTTLGLVAYVLTGWGWIIVPIGLDYVLRAMMDGPTSPMTRLATLLARALRLPYRAMDKASKVFASRIGVCFALGAAITHFVAPSVAPVLAGVLAVFTTLESVFDLCVGCVVYTYVALPLYRAREAALRVPLFSRLEDSMLVAVARGFQRVPTPADTTLMVEGEPGDKLYVIAAGRIEIFHVQADGARTVVGTRGPGEWVGEMALLTGERRNAHARTTVASQLLELDKAGFDAIVARHTGMRDLLERTAEARLADEAALGVG